MGHPAAEFFMAVRLHLEQCTEVPECGLLLIVRMLGMELRITGEPWPRYSLALNDYRRKSLQLDELERHKFD